MACRSRLCKECFLIDGKFTGADADLVFAKVVPKGLRRIQLEHFKASLHVIAEKKCLFESSIIRKVTLCAGPSLHGTTKAGNVRFHDDRSTYTGVRARVALEALK